MRRSACLERVVIDSVSASSGKAPLKANLCLPLSELVDLAWNVLDSNLTNIRDIDDSVV